MAKRVHSNMRNCYKDRRVDTRNANRSVPIEKKIYKYHLYLDFMPPQQPDIDPEIKKMQNDDVYRCTKQRESFKAFKAKKEETEEFLYNLNKKFRQKLFGESHAYL